MARRKDNILEQIDKLTGYFWQVDLFATLLMFTMTGISTLWCLSIEPSGTVGEALWPIFLTMWLLPLVCFGVALYFANKTYASWMNSH